MAKVFVTVPNTGWIHQSVVRAAMNLMLDKRHEIQIAFPVAKPIEANMHMIFQAFREKEADYLLSIDSDNPPQANPLDLVDLGLDMVGCPTPIAKMTWGHDPGLSNWPICWNAYDLKDGVHTPHEPKTGLQEVDGVGFGCFLLHSRVFKDPEMLVAPAAPVTNPNGTLKVSCDLAFCMRLKKRGFRVWAHYDYPCDHYKESSLLNLERAQQLKLRHAVEILAAKEP